MILSPKEKAKELVDKFIAHTRVFHETLGWEDCIDSAKQCALIAVDEILNINSVNKDFSLSHYWLDVKDEIINL